MAEFTLIIANRNYSSWSLRAWLAIRATGADFEEILVPLGRPETADEILRWSPSGRVPALRHGDLTIWDSLAVCEYLAERFPKAGLWPADRRARAVARSVAAEMHSSFMAVRGNMPMNIRASYPGVGRGSGVDEDVQRITKVWETCRREHGSDGDLLFGSFTIADAFFAPVISRFKTYGVKVEGIARDYMDAAWALPAVRDWVEKAHAEGMRVDRYELDSDQS